MKERFAMHDSPNDCGGAMEEFQNCWENVRHPYLTGKRDYIPESHASDSEKQMTGPAIQSVPIDTGRRSGPMDTNFSGCFL